MRPRDRIVFCFYLLTIAGVAVAGGLLLAQGLLDQWLRYRDFLAQGIGFTDRACALPFCDYPLFWEAGRLARAGDAANLYDNSRYFAAVAQAVAPHKDALPFMYPPVTLLLAAPLSLAGFLPGYYLVTALSLAAGVALLRGAGITASAIFIGLASVPAMWNFYLGQFGVLCAGLLIYGLTLLEDRPLAGGALLALLSIKPQYAPLLPVVVLAGRNLRAAIGGGLALAALVLLSASCFGWQSWAAFLGPGQATMQAFLEAPFRPGYETLGASIFWMARSFGTSIAAAYALQLTALLGAAVAVWRLWRPEQKIEPSLRVAATVLLVLLADPHAYTDDMVGYAVALPMLARADTPVTNAALAVLWLAPALAARFTAAFGFLPLPFCVAACLFIAWRRLAEPVPAVDRTTGPGVAVGA